MNEALQTALTQLLVMATTGVGFVIAETPAVIQELLMWHLVSNSAVAIIFSVLTGILLYYTVKLFAMYNAAETYSDKSDVEWCIGAGIVGIIGIVITVPVAAHMAFQVAKILIAPKVWLIEYAAQLAS